MHNIIKILLTVSYNRLIFIIILLTISYNRLIFIIILLTISYNRLIFYNNIIGERHHLSETWQFWFHLKLSPFLLLIIPHLCQQQVTSSDIVYAPSNTLRSRSVTSSNNQTHLPYGVIIFYVTAISKDSNIDQEGEKGSFQLW